MNVKSYSVFVAFLAVSGILCPAWATVDFNSYLPMAGTPAMPQFKFTKIVTIDYSEGGKLRSIFNGKTVNVSFSDNSDKNSDIRYLMNQINTNLQTGANSNAQFTNLNVDYNVLISGNTNHVVLNYNLVLTPTLVDYVINRGSNDVPTVLDLSWIGFTIKNPVTIATKQYGNLEINSLIGVIQNQFPDAYYILEGTAAENALNLNLIDSSPLVISPIDRWNTLFDPAYAITDATAGYTGQKVAATSFAYGQSDLYQGSLKMQNHELDFTSDAKYHLSVIELTNVGSITVEGHASGQMIKGKPAISTIIMRSGMKNFLPIGGPPVGGLSIMQVYLIASISTVIVAGVFLWSYKKWLK
ncbi:MAG: hypothetical protein KGH95_03860 [Thaumarchaeota archaeon]|nr:hypothetical protein [Nitrososphaerota archaeon]